MLYDSDTDSKWYAVYDSLSCRKLIIELEDATTEEEEEERLLVVSYPDYFLSLP